MSSGYLTNVRSFATSRPDHPALGVVGDDGLDVWSYRATWGAICAGSDRLAEAGVESGDRLAILGATEPAWGVAELAAMHRGAIVVPLDPNHPDKVLRSILEDAGVEGVLVSGSETERGHHLAGDGRVIAFDELFDRERDTGCDRPPEPVEPDHPRLLVYTSGTTGVPKGVTLTECNLTSQIEAVREMIRLTGDETFLSILPLNHVFAQIMNLLGPLYLGASVQFAQEPTPQAVRVALEKGGVTGFGAVPLFFSLFRDRVFSELRARGRWAQRAHGFLIAVSRAARALGGWNIGRYLFPTIHRAFGGRLQWVVCGGAYLDPGLGRQLVDWGFDVLVAYGLTEVSGAATVTPPGRVDVATVGQPLPDVEVRIDRPNAESVGEIQVRGATVMAGYWKRPQATREVIDDEGWFATGDLGSMDGAGNLVIRGRVKEMIVLVSGENVFPQELDDHYSSHALLGEVCVVGLPEPGGGERLHAVVVPDLDEFRRQGITTIEDYVRFEMETLALELPSYQRVRSYTIWRDPLPRTPTRKVRRLEVREQLLARGTSDSVASRTFEFTDEDRALLESEPMRAVIEAGALEQRTPEALHPDMNLEFDLGLDSLARAEIIAHLASRYAVDPEMTAPAMTPRELARIIETAGAAPAVGEVASGSSWLGSLEDPKADAEARRRLPEIRGWRTVGSVLTGLAAKALMRGYFDLRVIGAEHLLLSERPYVLAVNHVSYGDPFFVGAALPNRIQRDVFFLGYAGLLSGWLRGILSRALHVIPVDAGRHLAEALKLGAAGLRMGRILMIFPEGERTVDGRLREFKSGTAVLVRQTRVPAIPVAILGAHEIWGRHSQPVRRGTVTVVFGPKIDFAPDFGEDSEADHARITRVLREKIAELIQTHGGPPPH